MRTEQLADLLLSAARRCVFSDLVAEADRFCFPEELWDEFDDVAGQAGWDLLASAALSEVCHGMGFELEDDEP